MMRSAAYNRFGVLMGTSSRASSPRWLSLRGNSLLMITLISSQGDFCATASEVTSRLIQGYFACQDLGEQTLRGIAEPITVYPLLRESGATSRLDVAQPRGLTPLVGREQEVGILLER